MGEPPQADVKAAPPSAPQSPASAKTPTAKTGGRVALKPAAAKHPGGKSHPRQIANKAKATPTTPPATEPTPSAGRPTADTPTAQPSPANNGPFGLVQSAVDLLTSATAKLLQGKGIESGSRPSAEDVERLPHMGRQGRGDVERAAARVRQDQPPSQKMQLAFDGVSAPMTAARNKMG